MTNIRVLWKVIFAQLNLCDFKKKKKPQKLRCTKKVLKKKRSEFHCFKKIQPRNDQY